MGTIVSIDPGREKCGIAVVDNKQGVLFKKVIETNMLVDSVNLLMKKYGLKTVIIGNGTTSKEAQRHLENNFLNKNVTLLCVDEYRTTDMAKIRYWRENPPKGWRKIIPTSMQVPPVPVDDYVAVILAERYLNKI